MLDLTGKPVIFRLVERLRLCRTLDAVVVATTNSPKDDMLAAYLREELKVPVFRGNETDVLDRFYQCAREFPCEIVVRVTADDPLKDPLIIDQAVEFLLRDSSLDYCSNTIEPTFPEGLDIEVFRMSALEKAWQKARLPSEREHVTPYIWKNPGLFKTHNFKHREDLSSWRWTLDTEADLKFLRVIFDHFYPKEGAGFAFESVISFLRKQPELLKLNSGIARNAGYLKSVREETP